MSTPLGSSQFFLNAAQEGGQSLRFEDGDSPYLSWTPASAGNRKTWTYSTWIKRANLGGTQLFGINSGDSWMIRFSTSDKIACNFANDTVTNYFADSTRVFRDTSAWYHIVVSCDTTQSTASDRVKIYVNGELETITGGATTIPQNRDTDINVAAQHRIGAEVGNRYYSDGYIANACFIDGTALDPTSFGEYSDTLWKPKSDEDIQSLTFGTNGFYLPFKQTTEAEGFSTVTYTGNASTQSIEGVGFEPDLVWLKGRTTAYDHQIYDSVRGATERLRPSLIEAESTQSTGLTSFDSSGFTLGSLGGINNSSNNYVAWCWDAGSGSAASNTDGSITSSVKANTAKGFSIATYTGDGTSGSTFGHGLGVVPELIIVKRRSGTSYWNTYTSTTGATKYLELTTTAVATTATNRWNNTAPTSSVVTLGNTSNVNGSGSTYVAYSFASVSGYSSIGSYTGTGATGNKITTGFKPAFVMVKSYDQTRNWIIWDNTRTPTNPADGHLHPNSSVVEQTGSDEIQFDSDGFTFLSGDADSNTSGFNYIYMAFADTRDATFFGDTSGNGNNWEPNALNNTDVVPDSPVTGGNFATLNPVSNSDSVSLKEGSLEFTADTASRNVQGTMAVSSGKWYFEARMLSGGSAANGYNVGVATAGCANITTNPSAASGGIPSGEALNAVDSRQYFYSNDGGTNTVTSNSTAFVAGDIIGVALDLDSATQTVAFYKNGTIIGSAQTLAHQDDTWLPHLYSASTTNTPRIMNFGQDSSFAGNETPQGNTDDNGVGDFYYAPPSGFLALTTGNLPTPTITAPDEYFNTVLYTGTGSSQSITGINFQPDWVWWKGRNASSSHLLMNAVVGNTKYLYSNSTAAEQTDGTNVLTSFDSDGFTLPADTGGYANFSGRTYVAWNWLAGNGTVSNTDGSITSTVSANTTAGFSIVTGTTPSSYTSYSFGHGLNSAPEFVIWKERGGTSNWNSWHTGLSSSQNMIQLNTTTAEQSGAYYGTIDSSIVTQTGSTFTNLNSDFVAYCFHSVEGYSKIGSYTGNGSTDGTFVHCGFRPAFVMLKVSSTAENWVIFDNERSEYNLSQLGLYPNTSGSEVTISTNGIDMLSNGFKLKGTGSRTNGSGNTYIFLAFAEAPFKLANAR